MTAIALTNQRVFYPLLAEALIDPYLPATKPRPAVPDLRPQLTQRVRDFLTGPAMADAGFGSGQGMVAHQFASPFAAALLRGLGPLRSLRLIEENAGTRRYEAVFARKSMDWLARADAEGRLVELRPA